MSFREKYSDNFDYLKIGALYEAQKHFSLHQLNSVAGYLPFTKDIWISKNDILMLLKHKQLSLDIENLYFLYKDNMIMLSFSFKEFRNTLKEFKI